MHTLTLERKNLLKDSALVLLASFIICLSGYVYIPLWFTPVPIALQNSTVLLMAALLGSKRGTAAVFAFLAQGAMGLPVFSQGCSGLLHMVGPTGGYLFGYLVAAYAVGYIVERKQSLQNATLAFIVGNGIIYLLGAGYLATFVGIEKAFYMGIAPFLMGDLLKTLLSLKAMDWTGWKLDQKA